jgi:long-chain-alcohol oxidase
VNFTLRQKRALESICDTFLPRAEGWPSALELGIPDAIADAIADALDFNPRSKDRAQFLRLLDLWDSSLHSLIAVGRLKSFSSLSQKDRIRVLLSWADSGIGKRRAAFQALRKAVGVLHVMLPAANGARSPVWDNLNYPGPLRAREKSPFVRLL